MEAVNNHHQVLQLNPLEVCQHREFVLVMGSVMFLTLLVIPIIMLSISLVKVWIIFLSMDENLVNVPGV